MQDHRFDEQTDLVILGGSLQYVDDVRARDILARGAAALTRNDGLMYVRTSVATFFRGPSGKIAGT